MPNRKIKNAYEAYWFICNHPKFKLPERIEVTKGLAKKLEAKGYLISRDKDGTCYRYFRHTCREAIDSNLEIFYAKTNKPGGHGRVDNDKKKNKYIECWLEFGNEYYGYMAGGGEGFEWDVQTGKMSSHDPNLDSGDTTFDKAIVRLARKIQKHYGDYQPLSYKEKRAAECAINEVRLNKRGELEFVQGKKATVPCVECTGFNLCVEVEREKS